MAKRLYKQFNVYSVRQEDRFTVIATSAAEAAAMVGYREGPGNYVATLKQKGLDMKPKEMLLAFNDADYTPSDARSPKYDDFDLISDLEGKYTEV